MENLRFTLMSNSSLQPVSCWLSPFLFQPRHFDRENPAPVIVNSFAYSMDPVACYVWPSPMPTPCLHVSFTLGRLWLPSLGQTALPQPLPTNSVPPNGFCPRVFRERQEMTIVESPCLPSGVSGLQGHKLTQCLFFFFFFPSLFLWTIIRTIPPCPLDTISGKMQMFQILFSNKRPWNCLLSQELSRFSNKIMQHHFIMTAQNVTKILASPRRLQTGKLRTEQKRVGLLCNGCKQQPPQPRPQPVALRALGDSPFQWTLMTGLLSPV